MNDHFYQDKVVVITGASSGIGKELAFRLAAQGAWLSLAGRDATRLEAARAECLRRGAQAQALAVPTDVAELSGDVLRHRMVLSYEALAEDLTADDLLEPIVAAVQQPPIVMRDRAEEANIDEAAYQRPSIT